LGLLVVYWGTYQPQRTLLVPCSSPKKIKLQLDALLNDMGYSEDSDASPVGLLVYRRPALRQAFSGKIYLLIKDNQAQIRSRATHLRAIRKRLEKAGLKVTE
ncbi:MAG: hypothetical protein HC929_10105, partial [Leptolyngbyaceae cyanobacterium SM2_5_2]|nr:hypothetical protein [Leptolyngbyaceae cyanobacterium SM2_5_2]